MKIKFLEQYRTVINLKKSKFKKSVAESIVSFQAINLWEK
tara:strand:+ start:323 stop:442 length:120 start_codon:yes stop_codon:yes gene_type:complete